jgi:hypothetical protein
VAGQKGCVMHFIICTLHRTLGRMRWWDVACLGEVIDAHQIFIRKPEDRKPILRPRNRWEDGIKMDLNTLRTGRVNLRF